MRFFTIILVLLTTTLFANQSDSLKIKNWAIGVTVSPDYCYRVPYKVKSSGGSTSKESGIMGLTGGLNVLCRLMDKVGIEFGMLYSIKGQRVTTGSWLAPNSGYYDPSIPNYGTPSMEPVKHVAYVYRYLEIPLKVNVYLINKKFKLFPSIGCSANIFFGKKTATQYMIGDKNSTKITHDYDSNNIPAIEFGLLAGIGMSYDLNKNIFLKLEPSYRTFIRPIVDGPISGTFYSIVTNAGVYYRF